MKKVLTIVAVALLATGTLFAGVSFSGRFRQGYSFIWSDGEYSSKAWKTEEAKLVMKVSDDNGVWTVNLKNPGALDSNDKWAANATVNVDKIVKLAGGDMGDAKLAISWGNNGKLTALSAYTDPTGNEYYKFKNNGTESIQFALTYGKLFKLNVGVDPTYTKDTKDISALVSATTTPINGLGIGIAYGYNGYQETGYGKGSADNNKGIYAFNNGINASANIDLGKMLDMDFDLGLVAYDTFMLGVKGATGNVQIKDAKDKANTLGAAIYGGVDVCDLFAELVMTSDMPDGADSETVMGLNTEVDLNLVDNLGLDVYFNIGNFSKVGDTWEVGADVSYKIAGVEFAANVNYDASKTFSITPKMIIVY